MIVEARGSSSRSEREREREQDKAAEGMRRLDLPARGLSVEEENNVVTVRMQRSQRRRTGDLGAARYFAETAYDAR